MKKDPCFAHEAVFFSFRDITSELDALDLLTLESFPVWSVTNDGEYASRLLSHRFPHVQEQIDPLISNESTHGDEAGHRRFFEKGRRFGDPVVEYSNALLRETDSQKRRLRRLRNRNDEVSSMNSRHDT